MIIAQLSIAPVGMGTSLSTYVKQVIALLKEEKIRYESNAMATIIETDDLEHLFTIVQKAHKKVVDAGAKRVITELKIDDRRDKNVTMTSKLNSIK